MMHRLKFYKNDYSLLLPIEKQYQTQPIVKKGVNKKFSRLYLGI
jgi:hypothetical protein